MAESKRGKKTARAPEEKKENKFSKGQLLASERFREKRDMINAFLDEKEQYTIQDVEEMIGKYMKGKVK